MSKYLGDYIEDATIDFMFSTFSPVTSAPAALATGAVQVYKANNLGQTSTGVTLTADFDGITGQNHVRIDTSDSFYATANDYSVVLSGGTVGGVAVTGTVLATFSIENRNNRADLRKIDGTALSSATLNLKKLNVVNSSGDAAVFESTGSNGRGMYVQGHGTSSGAYLRGGDTNGHGIYTEGTGAGNGLLARCDTGSGDGIHAQGGDDGDACGIHAAAAAGSSGNGILAVGDGVADIEGKLGSDALDGISTTAPSGVASNYREMMVQLWRRFFKKATKSSTQILTYADNGSTVVTTQTISSSGSDETQGAAS